MDLETIQTEDEDELIVMDNSQVIKRRLKNLIFSDQFCGLCYEESNELHSFYTELEIFGDFGFHEVTVIDVINQIFKKDASKVVQDIQTRSICSNCLEQLNKCYLFISNMEYNNKVMTNYMDQLQAKVSEVDFIENQERIGIVLHHSEDLNSFDGSESRIKIEGASSFRCSRCNFEISNYDDLRLHERTHRWKAKINCNICKEVVYKQGFQEHLRIKHSLFTNRDLKPLSEIKPTETALKALLKLRTLTDSDRKFGMKSGTNLKVLPKLKVVTGKDLKALSRVALKRVCKGKENLKSSDAERSIKIILPATGGPNTCKLCFKDLDSLSLKTHKCQFSCTECDVYDCIHLNYLLEFREQMHNNANLTCPENDCDYSCKSRKQMIGHLNRVHLDHHPFTCDMCQQQFFSKNTLKVHIQSYHSPNYYCDYCDQDFSKEPEIFKDHFEECKETKRGHPCANCVAKFDSRTALVRHHLRGCRNFPCPRCNLKFTGEQKLIDHQSKVHNGVQRRGFQAYTEEELTCEICGVTCTSKSRLRSHKNTCHTEALCPDCGKMCTRGTICSHKATHSDPNGPLTCEHCGEQFRNLYSLRRHKLWHTEKVPCPICSKPIHKGRLRKHVQYHKSRNRCIATNYYYKVKCGECDFRTSNNSLLEAHVNQIHLKVRPYICSVCEKGYCAQFELNKHMEAHTRPNEIICNICDARLINKRSFRKHMARHTGNFPYKCDSCEKAFASVTQLKYHKVEHSSTRNYVCPVNQCESAFKDQRSMRQHVKKVHWTKKDKPFDLRDVKGLDKKYYCLFDDCRRKPIK